MKTLVIKIGSSVLFTSRGKLDEFRVFSLFEQIIQLKQSGYGIVLVLSGAIACGVQKIECCCAGRRGNTLYSDMEKRMQAGVGQAIFISSLLNICLQKNLAIAQMLLTQKDVHSADKEIVHVLQQYIKCGIIPILNENDVVELNSFRGNDLLAANIAGLLYADLVILSSYKTNGFGVGGAETKEMAIQMMREKGLCAVIKDGREKDCLLKGCSL